MTCLVGVEHKDVVYIAGDSYIGNDFYASLNIRSKVFFKYTEDNDRLVIGAAGDVRGAQLVEHKLMLPTNTRKSVYEYLVVDFVDALRSCFSSSGYSTIENNSEENESVLMIGYRGELWVLMGDYSVDRAASGFNALGAGGLIAKGVLEVTKNLKPRPRLYKALKATTRHSALVWWPFHMYNTSGWSRIYYEKSHT